jgi:hypothetical protein
LQRRWRPRRLRASFPLMPSPATPDRRAASCLEQLPKWRTRARILLLHRSRSTRASSSRVRIMFQSPEQARAATNEVRRAQARRRGTLFLTVRSAPRMTAARNMRCRAADGGRRRASENCAFVLMDHEHGRLRMAEPPLRFRPAEDVGVGRPKHQRVATTPTLNATAKTLAPIACFTSKIISSRCGLRKTKWWLAQGKRLLGRFWLRSVNAGNRIFLRLPASRTSALGNLTYPRKLGGVLSVKS